MCEKPHQGVLHISEVPFAAGNGGKGASANTGGVGSAHSCKPFFQLRRAAVTTPCVTFMQT